MSNGSPVSGTVSTPPKSNTHPQVPNQADPTSPIPRSASYTQLPADPKTDAAVSEGELSLSRSFSENVLVNVQGNLSSQNFPPRGSEDGFKSRTSSLRRLGTSRRRKEYDSQSTRSRFTVGPDLSAQDLAEESKSHNDGNTQAIEHRAPTVAGSITSLARKSWINNPRSPSPPPTKSRLRKEAGQGVESITRVNGSNPSFDLKTSLSSAAEVRGDVPIPPLYVNGKGRLSRRSSVLTKSRRPLSSFMSKSPLSETPSVPPIPKSYSTDRLPSPSIQSMTSSKPPSVPKSRSSEPLQGLGAEAPRRKDELWTVFRTLDGEYQKFQSRSSTMKTGIVRSILLPFLRNHAERPSILSLRPEDLDRRTFILNKWWTGLLEMLNGRHGESVSGNDRPAVLEAITALMARPEWTLPLSSIVTRPGNTARTSLKSQSTTSLGSNMSDILADSVHHNVRNTFTQNLLAQMAYVVDKMSTRNVAASVVTFCGKATAYAFVYCEGIAEILVRLWATPPETLRRVLAQGPQRQSEMDSVSDRVCSAYPQCLQSLKLKALRPTMKYLRSKPQSPVPIATTYIPWQGPWISRWAGKDTDLFFVFTKSYTDLACRFLPDNPSPEEIMAAPAWALVQAQILTILDTTMQQTNSQSANTQTGPSVTFDDLLAEADANATMLSLPAQGVVRTMGENRLIMLLRECLSNSTTMTVKSRLIFAQSFIGLLKIAARRISTYDHNACFTLCDFLEEAIPILQRYQQEIDAAIDIIDWSFWLDVCRHMLQSHNSMTEVRLFAFLYSMWSLVTSDEARRHKVCLDWLVSEDTFHANFNHWCPMVRAFFMRLIVWKIARLNGSGSDVNIAILEALDLRLQQVYRMFLYVQEHAQSKRLAPPSTAPCSPAPGRCLEIVRSDSQMASGGSFLTFDAILSSASKTKANSYNGHDAQNQATLSSANQPRKGVEDTNKSQDGGKKRWNLFKSMIPSSSPKDRPKASSAKSPLAASSLSGYKSAEASASKTAMNGTAGPARPYQTLSFKISLEWIDQDIINSLGRDRRIYPPQLPLPAQLSLQHRRAEDVRDTSPLEPVGVMAGPSRYAGRALAEWAILIIECQTFFERRKAEGVPSYQLVETPTLGVEPFRKV